MALDDLFCANVSLRNYSFTFSANIKLVCKFTTSQFTCHEYDKLLGFQVPEIYSTLQSGVQ